MTILAIILASVFSTRRQQSTGVGSKYAQFSNFLQKRTLLFHFGSDEETEERAWQLGFTISGYVFIVTVSHK